MSRIRWTEDSSGVEPGRRSSYGVSASPRDVSAHRHRSDPGTPSPSPPTSPRCRNQGGAGSGPTYPAEQDVTRNADSCNPRSVTRGGARGEVSLGPATRQRRLEVTSVAPESVSVVLQVRVAPGVVAVVPAAVAPLPAPPAPALGEVEAGRPPPTAPEPGLSHARTRGPVDRGTPTSYFPQPDPRNRPDPRTPVR